jgi:hypothetical protein
MVAHDTRRPTMRLQCWLTMAVLAFHAARLHVARIRHALVSRDDPSCPNHDHRRIGWAEGRVPNAVEKPRRPVDDVSEREKALAVCGGKRVVFGSKEWADRDSASGSVPCEGGTAQQRTWSVRSFRTRIPSPRCSPP